MLALAALPFCMRANQVWWCGFKFSNSCTVSNCLCPSQPEVSPCLLLPMSVTQAAYSIKQPASHQAAVTAHMGFGMVKGRPQLWLTRLMQALVSFVGDCPDTEVLHDVLELMCSLLHPHEASQRPLLACLADLGGIQLFMSLVQREQQSIRVLGLRIIAAFVPFPAASLSSPPGTTGLILSSSPHQIHSSSKKKKKRAAYKAHAAQLHKGGPLFLLLVG